MSKAISPWLISDAALHLRQRLRKEPLLNRRPLEEVTAFFNLFITWALGPIVLLLSVYISLSARSPILSIVSVLSFGAMLLLGFVSAGHLFKRLSNPEEKVDWDPIFWGYAGSCITIFFGMFFVVDFTSGGSARQLNLSGLEIVERPENWLPYGLAKSENLAEWCPRNAVTNCQKLSETEEQKFESAWEELRRLQYRNLTKKVILPENTSNVDLSRAFAVGYDFTDALLRNSNFSFAELEAANFTNTELSNSSFAGAELSLAKLEAADLGQSNFSRAQMHQADLRIARLDGANLIGAFMQEANLSEAQLQKADLRWAELQQASFSGAKMQGATLSGALMHGTNLWLADMRDSILIAAQLQSAYLNRAQLQGADLSYSFLAGTKRNPNELIETNLNLSLNNGGALRFVDLRRAIITDPKTDFRNAFMDGSVRLPEGFREQMDGLCQNVGSPLNDIEYFGRWRGWVESGDGQSSWLGDNGASPPGWEDVTPIPPPEGCEWKTGPMPGAE